MLSKGLDQIGFKFDDKILCELSDYVALVEKWNHKINLVSRKDIHRVVERHVFDSLSVRDYLVGQRLLDIGSGAGFPGLPLAICCPELLFTLVERTQKKSRFLNLVKSSLNLKNIDCQQVDLKESKESETSYDTILSRAVSDPVNVWRLCRSRLNDGGRLLFFLSTNSDGSIESAINSVEAIDGIDWQILDVLVPILSDFHKVLMIEEK